jgi:hypothetical protein
MQIRKSLPRNKKVPGRAAGFIFIEIKWPSGAISAFSPPNVQSAIRLFTHRLDAIPPAEREVATASFKVEIRRERGGLRRVEFARWSGDQKLGDFFRRARAAWKQVPKEYDDKGRLPLKAEVICQLANWSGIRRNAGSFID